ncbi:cytidylate kinase-like family protein [Clostridium sediminicola]|uniref:cytidylate kinase-like family protein n=1 Tax=Clostridium sediminicola TaxID=3114879 RepID=UPI0031F1FEF1
MKNNSPLVITISRQLGSGGSYLGEKLASELKFLYLDREIIKMTSEKLNIDSEKVEALEKRNYNWFDILSSYLDYKKPHLYLYPFVVVPIGNYTPTSKEVYKTEAGIILDVAQKQSAVILGRGGNYLLKDHPNHISILLYANKDFRRKRVQEAYKISEEEALKIIESTDKEREKYVHTYTKHDMTDALQYDLCIDTGVLGLEAAKDIILAYIRTRNGIYI